MPRWAMWVVRRCATKEEKLRRPGRRARCDFERRGRVGQAGDREHSTEDRERKSTSKRA